MPVARYSACETDWHKRQQPAAAACGVPPVANVAPEILAGIYQHYPDDHCKTYELTYLSVETAETWCRTCRLASMLYVLTSGGTATHLCKDIVQFTRMSHSNFTTSQLVLYHYCYHRAQLVPGKRFTLSDLLDKPSSQVFFPSSPQHVSSFFIAQRAHSAFPKCLIRFLRPSSFIEFC